MSKLRAIWELMRLEHGFMLIIAVLIGAAISNQEFTRYGYDLLFAFLTALLLEASTFSLNDYVDLEVDKKNRRVDRPLVRGDLKPKTALLLFFLLFPAGILFSLLVNMRCFYIAILTGALAVLYDLKLKKVKFVGNFYIAYTTAIPFIFGSVAVSEHIPSAVTVLSVIAFIASFGREVMKDIMDIEGDRAEGVKSIPMYLGEKKTSVVIALVYLLSVALSFVPFVSLRETSFYHNLFYLIPVLLTDSIFVYLSVGIMITENPPLKRYRNLSLFAMMIGLLAFLLGSLTGGR